ncbi:Succinate-semialdehyde dehydrogenase [NADP(+)] GabD [Rubrobacter xylanophilus DSM 9941]|uniref:aldehyde dehydrogenase family protein n=1 Tax=Rubrobacter xylanophilus TaxID=49319 RepID=UPI001F276DF3|nr:aldehyde dehydrogenase family protein [Rubrobacter xylanophilus]QYJ15036.1 Succinate-semialdehyde dehydrogenase [NADP(+)] GabD [Rubrobacter xylanophilus DSM 9941]
MAEPFVGGEYLALSGLERIPVVDPATGAEVDTVPVCGEPEVDAAVRNAREALSGWQELPASKRGEILGEAARAVLAARDELAPLLTGEQGKPLREARIEIRRFVHTLEHYAGLAKNIRGGYVPDLDEGAYGLILRRPVGVVGAIVPWNFPTTLLANKLGPALVAGNAVVAKPAETTPLTTLRIAEIMHEAGLPAGVFNVVTGDGPTTGQALAGHPLVRKVAFTGSTPVGRKLAALAAGDLKRVTLELGGSDPMIVCDDANLDRAASAASVGRFFNCGQACLAVKRLYVFESVAEEFVEKLVGKVRRLRVGPGTAEGVMLGPLHTPEGRELLEGQVRDAVESGARVLAGGRRPEGEVFEKGNFYEPTLLLEPAHDSRVATEEVFGPALPIWKVADLEEAIERANGSIYGLGSSIWTADLDRATEAAERIEAGYTWINSPQIIYDELPFGGWKQSGYGKEHGMEAIEYYTETKSVVVRRASRG